MSDGSNLNRLSNLVSFKRFSAYDVRLSYEPDRWLLQWPTYVALVFPHPEPEAYIGSIPKPPILEVASYRVLEVQGRARPVVSLLFDGLIKWHERDWRIVNPRYPKIRIPIPDNSDVFLADSKTVSPDTTMVCLAKLLVDYPPSALIYQG